MCCFVWIGGNDVTATTDINQFEVHIDRSGVDMLLLLESYWKR
jgi:hypothetical protein